jgi:UDPglucose 6-dehydrogenase
MAKVGIFGAGWVGLVTGVCFAELGHEVVIRDIVPQKIDALRAGEVPFHETDVPELLERNAERLTFTLDVNDIADCEFLFVAVDTPPTKSGDADLSRVWSVVDELPELPGHPILVMKSTVPVGTGEKVRHGLDARGLSHVGYASNPEFLAEGQAVRDFMEPDRVVVGAFDSEDADAVARLYDGVDAPIVRADVNSAEMIKLAANAALATRVSFINEIANVCEVTGADVVKVAEGIGLDTRIGSKFLRAGIGYGGSCLRGREWVFVREGDAVRQTTLETLFSEMVGDVAEENVIAEPDDLEVLSWSAPGGLSFQRVAMITRRRFTGDLLGVRHSGAGPRPRVTPDHPFVVANSPDGTTAVKLASELAESDWLPIVDLARANRSRYPQRVPVLATGDTVEATAPALWSAEIEQAHVGWVSVEGLSSHPYDDYVYSFEIPPTHTFVTTGGLVTHNCFPKDSLALKQLASNSGYHFQLLAAVIEVNELQKRRIIGKLQRHLGPLRGKTVALLGLAYKPDTDDMREAPSIVLAARLLAEGAHVRGWDPVADIAALPGDVESASSIVEAVTDADAAVIVTEWNELRTLVSKEVREAMRNPLIIDGRNLLDPAETIAAGFTYEGIGRLHPSHELEPA